MSVSIHNGMANSRSIEENNELEEESSDDPGHQAALGAIAVAASAFATSASDISTPSASQSIDDASQLLEETQNPLGAMALVLALAWDPVHDGTQEHAVAATDIDGLADLVRRWREPCGRGRRRSACMFWNSACLLCGTVRGSISNLSRIATELDRR